ncbi:MAG TPA: glycosyltransferase family A protein, partial [Rhodopila sp.]|nr:glycosyltransferase family A protein [Rhodopila sp.]
MIVRPDVSVIIPTRDAIAWLPSAIASIGMDQRAEIIVVDDGSTDGTLCWLGKQATVDDRLRFLHGTRAGFSRARNLGISAATAPLIAFLNFDDRWLPGKLDMQLALHAAHPEIGFSFATCRRAAGSEQGSGECFKAWRRFAGGYAGTGQSVVIEHPV